MTEDDPTKTEKDPIKTDEYDLDEEVLKQFASKIEETINAVIKGNLDKNCTMELLSILISFSSQISAEIGIDKEEFLFISEDIYKQVEEQLNELSRKIIHLDVSKLN